MIRRKTEGHYIMLVNRSYSSLDETVEYHMISVKKGDYTLTKDSVSTRFIIMPKVFASGRTELSVRTTKGS